MTRAAQKVGQPTFPTDQSNTRLRVSGPAAPKVSTRKLLPAPEPRVAVLIGNDDDISFWYPLLIAASRAARAAATGPLLTCRQGPPSTRMLIQKRSGCGASKV